MLHFSLTLVFDEAGLYENNIAHQRVTFLLLEKCRVQRRNHELGLTGIEPPLLVSTFTNYNREPIRALRLIVDANDCVEK